MAGKSDTRKICVGALAGAHGVKGEVKVKSFTQNPADFAAYGPLMDEAGTKIFTFKIVREAKPSLFVARAAEIKTREDAETLKSTKLYVSRSALPAPDEDEFYHEDLVGLNAVTVDGAPYGKIKAVVNYGADDLLELFQIPDVKGAVLIPFTKADVPSLDFETGQVTIVPPVDNGEKQSDEEG